MEEAATWGFGASFLTVSEQFSHGSLGAGLAQHTEWAKWPYNLFCPSDALTLLSAFFPQENIQANLFFVFFCISKNKLAIWNTPNSEYLLLVQDTMNNKNNKNVEF